LEEPRPDPHWLDAIEHETAEIAVAVAAQRAETVARLQQALAARDDPASVFPASEIALKGWIEELIRRVPARAVEDRYRAVLKDNRGRDAAAGRTLDGPHLTDLAVTHARKRIPAADASTGEQKALLIGLVLAHASLLADMSGFAPILLLDEVVAHLDPGRRTALFGELEGLGAQVWMTGADPAAFAEIESRAQVFEVAPGRVARKPARMHL
jgi:DNA replication and repair protein RecF